MMANTARFPLPPHPQRLDRHQNQPPDRGAPDALAGMGSRSLAGLPLGFERTQLGLLLGEQVLDHFPLRGIVFRGEQPPVVLDIEASDILWGIQVPPPVSWTVVALKSEG
jgi:hypothetical protein